MDALEHLLNSLFLMASMVEARDPYTGGHLWRVSQFCRVLAENGGLPPNQVARISLGGFLHDLGKITVPDAILNKPDRLTVDEYEIIKTHPDVGRRLLIDHPLAGLAEFAVFGHHERPDGMGYPLQLPHERISIDACIVGICDAFDTMPAPAPTARACRSRKRSTSSVTISVRNSTPRGASSFWNWARQASSTTSLVTANRVFLCTIARCAAPPSSFAAIRTKEITLIAAPVGVKQ